MLKGKDAAIFKVFKTAVFVVTDFEACLFRDTIYGWEVDNLNFPMPYKNLSTECNCAFCST